MAFEHNPTQPVALTRPSEGDFTQPNNAEQVKAIPVAILIQPNILTGAGVTPCSYKECTSVGFYLLRKDGSKDWLTDINKSDNTSKDYSHVHSTAARFSMEYSAHILPFEMS